MLNHEPDFNLLLPNDQERDRKRLASKVYELVLRLNLYCEEAARLGLVIDVDRRVDKGAKQFGATVKETKVKFYLC